MFLRWPIRRKLLLGLALLVAVVGGLASSGLYATYTYRRVVKDLSWRAVELPLAAELSVAVAELRNTVSELRGRRVQGMFQANVDGIAYKVRLLGAQFQRELCEVDRRLAEYRGQLEDKARGGSPMADCQREWRTVRQIEGVLAAARDGAAEDDWPTDHFKIDRIDAELERLQQLVADLPSHLHKRLGGFADEVRGQYRGLIALAWSSTLGAVALFLAFLKLSYDSILRPLRTLLMGSRRVAGGDFNHRISMPTADEMAELGDALNGMTARFQSIRDDLDRQVQQRTKEVVRSEQLASVGFLAAGVAHEINNPLASIAMCAESLEARAEAFLAADHPDREVVVRYLHMIQEEAFRCKDITEKLLDFSRIGETRRQICDLVALAGDVIEMLRHLGKYQQMRLKLDGPRPVLASVNAREIKQVVLNLLTNALDSVEAGGEVRVAVGASGSTAEIAVRDNGCGMPPEVLEHVFEPFFTRRKAGQGTGLGLSISYRIVADHGGALEAASDGPGRGATFRVRLPLAKENRHERQAA